MGTFRSETNEWLSWVGALATTLDLDGGGLLILDQKLFQHPADRWGRHSCLPRNHGQECLRHHGPSLDRS